jgi:hypothetical protein
MMHGLPAMLVCLSLHEFGRGLFRPIMGIYTQRRVDSRCRATFGSLQSLLGKIGCAAALLLMWALTDGRTASHETIVLVWSTCGTLLLLGTLLLWVFRPRE